MIVLQLLGLALFAGSDSTSTASRPNVVLILVDDLGYGDLGCYGQEKIATPHIDRLAHEGRRYTQFYAGSTVCAPSRCVLMTGLHTGHCLIRGNALQDLRPEDVTVAEVLQGAGYVTGLTGKWGLGHEGSDGMPTRQGFASFFGYLDQRHAHNFYPTFLLRGEERVELANVVPNEDASGAGQASTQVAYSHDLFIDDALAFVSREHASPFFLYLALTIPHANNEAGRAGMEVPHLGPYADRDWPAPERGFAGMLHRLDQDVGRLVERIDALGKREDTLILFTSDNGPHSEGGHRAGYFDSNGPLRGQKRDLFDGGIRVPLIARWPGSIPAGTVSEHLTAFQDVFPTLAELAEVEADSVDGLSFAASLRGDEEAQPEHADLYWAFYERGGGRALRAGRWKVIEQPIGSSVRLYDLSLDIGEENDLAASKPELVRELVTRMDASDEPSERWNWK